MDSIAAVNSRVLLFEPVSLPAFKRISVVLINLRAFLCPAGLSIRGTILPIDH
jgi:hypothetical protein